MDQNTELTTFTFAKDFLSQKLVSTSALIRPLEMDQNWAKYQFVDISYCRAVCKKGWNGSLFTFRLAWLTVKWAELAMLKCWFWNFHALFKALFYIFNWKLNKFNIDRYSPFFISFWSAVPWDLLTIWNWSSISQSSSRQFENVQRVSFVKKFAIQNATLVVWWSPQGHYFTGQENTNCPILTRSKRGDDKPNWERHLFSKHCWDWKS